MKINFSVLLVLLLASLAGFSQIKNYRGEKGFARKAATVNIKEIGKKYNEEKHATPKLKVPNAYWKKSPHFNKIKASEVIYLASKRSKNSNAVREISPAPDTTFQALNDNGTSIPPDVNGAAGLNYLMVTLNTQVRIQDRQGNNLMTTTLSNFWGSMPNSGASFDPKILYDPYQNRWIMVTASGSNADDSRLYLGVSLTDNPLGDWNMFWIKTDPQNQTWLDYPSIGFNKKWITVSGNMFGNGFYRAVFVIDKMSAFNGDDSVPYTRFATSQAFTLAPSVTYDPNAEEMYLIATSSGNSGGYGYIKKFMVSGDVDNPQFQYQGAIGIPEPWGSGEGDFLPQLGTYHRINSVDSRMQNVMFRNGKLWAVHHVFLPANNPQRCAVQWWELDTAGVLLNHGRIEDNTNVFSFAFPTIAVNSYNDVLIGYDVFSSTQYASAGYSYKAYSDNDFRTYYQFKDGLAPYYKTFGGNRNRWGDYSATCVDPVNDVDFWTIQEYAELPQGSDKWGTWWAYMKPSFFPVTNFEANNVIVPIGESINFTDLTLGIPTAWQWTFDGATPDTSTTQNPSEIFYNTDGSYDVSLISSNSIGSDTLVKTNYITVSSTILPEVHFYSDNNFVCTGDTVSFTDSSLYMPITWQWQFDPSTVTFVNGTDQNSQNPQVVFDEPDTYSVTLTAWNTNGSSELTKSDMIIAGGYVPFFHETFEEDLKSHHWTIRNPDEDATWEKFDVGGNSPGHTAMGVNFREIFGIGKHDWLVSPAFNLSGMNTAYLSFQHAYAQRNAGVSDSLFVLVSNDCGNNWTRIFAGGEDGSGNFATHEPTDYEFIPQTATDWCGAGWGSSCITLDLTPWAGQDNIEIAFETYSMFGNPIFIDNVFIDQFVGIDEIPEQATLNTFPNPTHNGFEVVWKKNRSYNFIRLQNTLGKIVFSEKINEGDTKMFISTKNLSPGIYIVNLNGKLHSLTKKVIVY